MYGAMPYYPLPDQPIGAIAIDPRRRHVRRLAISVGAAAVLAVTLAVGAAFGVGPTRETSAFSGNNGSSSSAGQVPGGSTGSGGSSATNPGGSAGSAGSSSTNPNAIPNVGGDRDGDRFGSGSGSSGSGAAAGAIAATAAQQKGVVTIDSQLAYQGASSAGTGMILSADGLVLTNNHVIDGATAIQVTDESTGRQYTATVVGTDPTADVALLQLKGASGLTPITLDKNAVTTGTSITAIGNAEGTGNLVAAAGSVTNTNQTMTAQTELGGSAETLSGLIEFQAAVVSGDSGGPVLDSQGEVVGMTTAASNGMGLTDAYAITIVNALTVVHEIQAGDTANGTITLGYPAFLGVSLSTPRSQVAGGSGTGSGTTSGATIAGVVTGTPAASAGLAAGDTITAVNGAAVTSADGLSSALGAHKAGDRVTITWVSGTTGATHSATVTLIAGPAN
jgi:S1-C subfamily serine protease